MLTDLLPPAVDRPQTLREEENGRKSTQGDDEGGEEEELVKGDGRVCGGEAPGVERQDGSLRITRGSRSDLNDKERL
jgi:hypothetical protein